MVGIRGRGETGCAQTFKNNENQSKIAKLDYRVLHGGGEPFPTGRSPCDTEEDLAYQSSVKRFVEDRIHYI